MDSESLYCTASISSYHRISSWPSRLRHCMYLSQLLLLLQQCADVMFQIVIVNSTSSQIIHMRCTLSMHVFKNEPKRSQQKLLFH